MVEDDVISIGGGTGGLGEEMDREDMLLDMSVPLLSEERGSCLKHGEDTDMSGVPRGLSITGAGGVPPLVG